MRHVRDWLALPLALAMGLFAVPAAYAAPAQWTFRGRYDAFGEAIADGFRPVTLQLYASPTGGTPLWSVNQIVPIEDGFVNAQLESPVVNGVDLFAQHESLWMELITDEGTYPTRVQIASAPFARQAADCQTVGGYTAEQLLAGSGSGGGEDVAALRAQLAQVQVALAQVQSQVAALTTASGNAVTRQSLDLELDSRQVLRRPPAGDPLAPVTRQELTAALGQYVTTQTFVATVTQTVNNSVGERIPTRIEPSAVAVANGLGRSSTVSIDAAGTPTDVVFSGVNVHVRNGLGSTACPTGANGALQCNGRGNLFVGYNASVAGAARTGSHNIVIGDLHAFSAYGGFVSGTRNTIASEGAAVLGGNLNTASGARSVVVGGQSNQATGEHSVASGGTANRATASFATVSGGRSNLASDDSASVSGGKSNVANGKYASISGGASNVATGESSSISGGQSGESTGAFSSVTGGQSGKASGQHSVLLGGNNKESSAQWSTETAFPIKRSGNNLIIEGVNLVVRDGSGKTNCATDDTCSGLGNLIIGYNEKKANGSANIVTGQHNLVLGLRNDYSSFGGVITGTDNAIAGPHSSILSGSGNDSAGSYNAVVGGASNSAIGTRNVIVGGMGNDYVGNDVDDAVQHNVIVGGVQSQISIPATRQSVIVGGAFAKATSASQSVVIGGNDARLPNAAGNPTDRVVVVGTPVARRIWSPPAQ